MIVVPLYDSSTAFDIGERETTSKAPTVASRGSRCAPRRSRWSLLRCLRRPPSSRRRPLSVPPRRLRGRHRLSCLGRRRPREIPVRERKWYVAGA